METGTRRTQRSFPEHVACDTPPARGRPHRSTPRRGAAARRRPFRTVAWAPAAFAFVDWLADAGQAWWQVLPITPPDRYGSPYASPSAFAGWAGYLAAPRAAVSAAEVADFRERNGYWIDDWARAAGPGALEDQVRLDREWRSLRDHAASRGVRILGDLPFYVAPRGADVAAHPGLFRSDLGRRACPRTRSRPTASSGATPPTTGRPCAPRGTGGGSSACAAPVSCSTPSGSTTSGPSWPGGGCRAAPARRGPGAGGGGPGAEVIDAARAQLGALSLVAEDLGVITAPVRALMARLGLPGMRVIQFAFEGGPGNTHRLENHVRHAVVYSGTHDNQTAARLVGDGLRRHATGGHGRRRRARASPASPRTGCSCGWRSPRRRAWRSCPCRTCWGWGTRPG